MSFGIICFQAVGQDSRGGRVDKGKIEQTAEGMFLSAKIWWICTNYISSAKSGK